jgi:hypothetical protein
MAKNLGSILNATSVAAAFVQVLSGFYQMEA